jgi:hypothetical protein
MHYLKLSFSKRVKTRIGAQVRVQTKDANLGHHRQHDGWNLGHQPAAISGCSSTIRLWRSKVTLEVCGSPKPES